LKGGCWGKSGVGETRKVNNKLRKSGRNTYRTNGKSKWGKNSKKKVFPPQSRTLNIRKRRKTNKIWLTQTKDPREKEIRCLSIFTPLSPSFVKKIGGSGSLEQKKYVEKKG